MTNDGFPPERSDREVFIHQRVKVTLDYNDPEAYQIGVLVGLSEDGEAIVVDDTGHTNHCWPALRIEEVGATIVEPDNPKFWMRVAAGIVIGCLLIVIVGLTAKFTMWVL